MFGIIFADRTNSLAPVIFSARGVPPIQWRERRFRKDHLKLRLGEAAHLPNAAAG
jgi:hypothetical protein